MTNPQEPTVIHEDETSSIVSYHDSMQDRRDSIQATSEVAEGMISLSDGQAEFLADRQAEFQLPR